MKHLDKYILSSHLQKSIRLNQAELASETTEHLYNLDKSYLMYRMMIIAFEDIGVGNLQLLGDITKFRWGVRNFKERNIVPIDYFKDLAQKLANSPKDRTACDSTYLIKMALQRGDQEILSLSPLKEIYESWQALGTTRYQLGNLEPDNIEAYKNYLTQSGGSTEFAEQFFTTQVEPFFLALPYLAGPYELNPIRTQPMDFMLSAIDGHTRLGRECIYELMERLSITADFYVVKMCLFRVEGQQVTPKLEYPHAHTIKNLIQRRELQYNFPQVSWTQYVELGKTLKKNIHVLNEIRQHKLLKLKNNHTAEIILDKGKITTKL